MANARVLIVALALLGPAASQAIDVATAVHQTDRGPIAVVADGPTPPPETSSSIGAPVPGGARAATLLWTRHHVDPIYTSCAIAGPEGPVFAGTTLNPPQQVETVPVGGDGTPDWTSGGTEFFVDAARGGLVLAAVDFHTADSSAVISEWRPGSSTPLWSYTVHPCRSMTYQGWATRKPVQVSDDGTTIAVALTMYTPAGQVGRLFAFETGNGTPVVDWPFPAGNVVATAISADGGFVAMAGWPTLYVYDVTGDALRWSGPIGSGNDALAISPSGEYIAWGWTSLFLRRWNGSAYTVHHTISPGAGTYLGQVAFSAADMFAVTWDNGNVTPNELAAETYTLAMPSLRWRHDYVGTPPSTHVDVASAMHFSPSGDHLAIGSWGGSFPEIHLFDVLDPSPIYTLDTPGSIFDLDIVDGAGEGVLVAACGKGVHAGTGGRGGDLYLIATEPVVAVAEAPAVSGIHLSSRPNPFNPSTTIRFTLPSARPYTLTIHDATGRRVGGVAGLGHESVNEFIWNGRDDAGRVLGSGIYFARMVAGDAIARARLTLAR